VAALPPRAAMQHTLRLPLQAPFFGKLVATAFKQKQVVMSQVRGLGGGCGVGRRGEREGQAGGHEPGEGFGWRAEVVGS
jgi:hypothetical protein